MTDRRTDRMDDHVTPPCSQSWRIN